MGKLGILYRHDDGKTTQFDTQAWNFAPWVKEKLSRVVKNQLLLRHDPTPEERKEIDAAIAAGRLQAPSAEAFVTRRKAAALLDLLDDVETLGQVFLEQGLVVLQPKGLEAEDLPTTRLEDEELEVLRPRLV
jgi:hypothetical protein